MALIGKIAISMGVDVRGLQKGLNSARRDLNAFANNVTSLGLQLGAIGAVGALAIGKTVVAASNLEEQADRTRDQFGAFADQVIEQSNLLAKAFGLSKVATLESASVLSAIFESAGYAGKGVADLSVHFVKLSTDLSRFANIPFKEALRKIESGLVGQVRPLREVGVALSEAATDAYAYAHGIAKVGAQLTDSEKVQARAGFIAEALAKSWGNTAKTGDKVAGAIEGVKGRFENLAATIGDSLLLIAAPLLGDIQVGIQALETSWVTLGQSALGSSSVTMEGLTAQHHSIGILQQAVGALADEWRESSKTFLGLQAVVTQAFTGWIYLAAKLEEALGKVTFKFGAFGGSIKSDVFKAWALDLQKITDEQNKVLENLNKAPKPSTEINQAFDQARKDIQGARDKLKAMGKLDVLSIKPTNLPAPLGGKEHKGFAHSAEFGSAEAANTILRSVYGVANDNAAAQTAKNTAKLVISMDKLVQHFANAGAVQILQGF